MQTLKSFFYRREPVDKLAWDWKEPLGASKILFWMLDQHLAVMRTVSQKLVLDQVPHEERG